MSEELNGLYPGMDFASYAAVDALNGSSLMALRRSPMRYRHERDNPTPPTPAMILGTATHRLILEPDRVGDFAVWGTLPEEKVRNGKVWKNFKALNAGALIVTKAERDAMVGMAVGARKNVPIMKYANAKGDTEVSMFWRDANGRRWKGRVDKILKGHVIADLKTTRDCHPRKFGSQAFSLGYHIKMAIYWDGYRTITGEAPTERLLAIDSKEPHESVVYRVTKDVIMQGLEERDELVRLLDECEKTNNWPPAYEDETDLLIPAWAVTEQDSLAEFAEETEEV
jgi:exodeoxyribonuclease VIII